MGRCGPNAWLGARCVALDLMRGSVPAVWLCTRCVILTLMHDAGQLHGLGLSEWLCIRCVTLTPN